MFKKQPSITGRLLSADQQTATIKRRIERYLRVRSGVTLVELERDIPGFSGRNVWASDRNIVIWSGMSDSAIDAMMSLIAEEKIEPTVTTWLVYNFDGQMLDMPIADRFRQFKEPHWLPVVFAGNMEAIDGAS